MTEVAWHVADALHFFKSFFCQKQSLFCQKSKWTAFPSRKVVILFIPIANPQNWVKLVELSTSKRTETSYQLAGTEKQGSPSARKLKCPITGEINKSNKIPSLAPELTRKPPGSRKNKPCKTTNNEQAQYSCTQEMMAGETNNWQCRAKPWHGAREKSDQKNHQKNRIGQNRR